jgi:hypothetical protein
VRRVLAFSACCALLAGCGGGARQDADEKAASYDVQVLKSSFPREQSISQPAKLRISVRNTGKQAIPDLAVSLTGLVYNDDEIGVADPERPVWIVTDQPREGQTAYDFTWAVGELPAGATRELSWTLAPAVPGTHTLKWAVAAGLNGRAKAQVQGGGPAAGTFTVAVSDKPAPATVDPDTGAVVRG